MRVFYRRQTDPAMPPLWPPILGLIFLAIAVVSLVVSCG